MYNDYMGKRMMKAQDLKIGTEFYSGAYWRRVVGIQYTGDTVKVLAMNWNQPPRSAWPASLVLALDEEIEVRA